MEPNEQEILHGDLVDIEELKEKLSHYAFVRSDITIDDLVKQLTIIIPSNERKTTEISQCFKDIGKVIDE